MVLNLPPASPSSPTTLRAYPQTEEPRKITVLGAGAFGQAMAIALASGGHSVRVLDIIESRIIGMNTVREDGRRYNPDFLTTIPLPETCVGVFDPAQAFDGCDLIFSAIPIQFCEGYLTKIKPFILAEKREAPLPFVSLSKGIALSNLELIHQVYERVFAFDCKKIAEETASTPDISQIPSLAANRAAIFGDSDKVTEPEPETKPVTEESSTKVIPVFVSGPSFAEELAMGLPTGLSVGSPCQETAYYVANVMKSSSLVPTVTTDYIGVELLGALKNCYAIGAGMVQGLYPNRFNTFSLFTTLSLNEMRRLSLIFGASEKTLSGFAGLGDAILSFSGPSRNRELGTQLAITKLPLSKLIEGSKGVVEGVPTTKALFSILSEREVIRHYPLLRAIYSCLYNDQPAADAFDYIFSLPIQQDYQN